MTSPFRALAQALLGRCSVPIVAPEARQEVVARFSSSVPQVRTALDVDRWSRTGDGQPTQSLALARSNAARRNLGSAGTPVGGYATYFAAIDADWQAGRVSLLDREEPRRQVQTARVTRISQQLALTRQRIALYTAMGGGWQHPAADAAASEGT